VTDPVWELYRLAHQLTGGVSSLLEWDAKIPPFPVVHTEVLKAREHMAAELEMTEGLVKFRHPQPDSLPEREGEVTEITPPHPATLVLTEVE
jgi:hypothetical protein